MKQNGKLAAKGNKQLKGAVGKAKDKVGNPPKAKMTGKLMGAKNPPARQGKKGVTKKVIVEPESEDEEEIENEVKEEVESDQDLEKAAPSDSEDEPQEAEVDEDSKEEPQQAENNEDSEEEPQEELQQAEDDEDSEEEQLDVNGDGLDDADEAGEDDEDNEEVPNDIDGNSSDSDAPTEEPIKKSSQTEKKDHGAADESENDSDAPDEARIKRENDGIYYGSIPSTIPNEQVVRVTNLTSAPELKYDLAAHFKCCGTITNLKINPRRKVKAFIAFTTPEEAKAAIEKFHGTTFKDATINVTLKWQTQPNNQIATKSKAFIESTVRVSNLPFDIVEVELHKFFTNCGRITAVKINRNANSSSEALVTFLLKASVDEAIQLSGKKLREQCIVVERLEEQKLPLEDPKRSVVLQNSEPPLRPLQWHQLKEIFLKIGRFVNYVVVGHQKCAVIITYPNEKCAQKALALNDTISKENIKIKVVPFTGEEYKHAILVENLAEDVTDDDLRAHFKSTGTITEILRGPGGTVLKFSNRTEYCLAFLENESRIKDQPIYLQPFTLGKLTYANQQSFLLRKYLALEKKEKRQIEMYRKYTPKRSPLEISQQPPSKRIKIDLGSKLSKKVK